MTKYLVLATLITLAACSSNDQHSPNDKRSSGDPRQSDNTQSLQSQIDSLQKKLAGTYRPGLGEFMSGIQVHHAKLWFAATAANWKLADFEVGEIKESLDDIEKYCTDRPEIASIPMIRPALDTLAAAVTAGSTPKFKSAFALLTTTCNNCHRVTKHEFNVIKVPATPPFTNQEFAKQQ